MIKKAYKKLFQFFLLIKQWVIVYLVIRVKIRLLLPTITSQWVNKTKLYLAINVRNETKISNSSDEGEND